MSSLNDVSNEIENRIASDEFGWGEPIYFASREDYLAGPYFTETKAMPMVRRQDAHNEKSKVYEDRMAFLSVNLSVRPARGDYIKYDDEIYVIETLEGVAPYDIFCRTNSRHSRGRSQRVEK